MLPALDHIADQARENQVSLREDIPTEERDWATFLSQSGLSYQEIGLALGHSHEAVHQWYHQIAKLSNTEPDRQKAITTNGTKVAVEDQGIYVRAAIDVETFEIVHVEVSPGRSDLGAFLFLKPVLIVAGVKPSFSPIASLVELAARRSQPSVSISP